MSKNPAGSRVKTRFPPSSPGRARFIIRTRAQLAKTSTQQPATREPLDAPIGSSSQPTASTEAAGSPIQVETGPLSNNRKRALSPPNVPEPTAKRVKHTPSPVKGTASNLSSLNETSRPTVSLEVPRADRATAPMSTDHHASPSKQSVNPRASPSPMTITSAPMTDIFNPTPGSPTRSPPKIPRSSPFKRPYPAHDRIPPPKLFATNLLADKSQASTPSSSQLRIDDDEPMEESESPSKKAKITAGTTPSFKLGLPFTLPRKAPAPTPGGTSSFKGPTLKPLEAKAARAAAAASTSTSTLTVKINTPSLKRSPPNQLSSPTRRSPSKRAVSDPFPNPNKHPPRPNTSMGFYDNKRKSTLPTSTQNSLSNLSMAMEKLSAPRLRASLPTSSRPSSAIAPLASSSRPSMVERRSVSAMAGPTLGMSGGRLFARRPPALSSSTNSNGGIGFRGAPSLKSSMLPPSRPAFTVHRSPTDPPVDGKASSSSSSKSVNEAENRLRRVSTAARSLTMVNPSSSNLPSPSSPSSSSSAANADKKKTGKKSETLNVLKDCVIYVDVKMEDGSDAGELFITMLKGLGARILTRPTPNITHIVFKAGSPTTLNKHKLYNDPKPFLVGIGWVVECVEKRMRVDETKFLVDEPDPIMWSKERKKRKSMQPKMIRAISVGAGLVSSDVFNAASSTSSLESMAEETEEEMNNSSESPNTGPASSSSSAGTTEKELAPLERARRRTQYFAPKVSSPLKKSYRPRDLSHDGDDDYIDGP